ncbi:MAG TPA: quinone oxidoreductase [Acidimicrobiia bacterium]|nr:quinone oxidoreductase [Acidimicrobiia bacterium]
MKAIVVHEAGDADQLRLEDVPEPAPGEGDLLVKVEWAGLNFIDTYQRSGLYPLDFPFTPGLEGAGAITALGDGVDGFSAGDRVAWVNALGSYAELHVVPADAAVPVPDAVGTDVAAAVLLQGITAHYLATSTHPLSGGDRCLVHAGAGGVGLLLTQIAKMRGAHVITTVGSEEKAELSRDAGADEVIVYTDVGFKEEIEHRFGPHPLDVVYDGVGADTFDDGVDLLRPRGMMVTFGNASGPVPEIAPLMLAQKGSIFLTRPTMAHYMRTREELLGRVDDLFEWIAAGDLDVRIGAEYPLERAAEAHRALVGRETTGKVLLHP